MRVRLRRNTQPVKIALGCSGVPVSTAVHMILVKKPPTPRAPHHRSTRRRPMSRPSATRSTWTTRRAVSGTSTCRRRALEGGVADPGDARRRQPAHGVHRTEVAVARARTRETITGNCGRIARPTRRVLCCTASRVVRPHRLVDPNDHQRPQHPEPSRLSGWRTRQVSRVTGRARNYRSRFLVYGPVTVSPIWCASACSTFTICPLHCAHSRPGAGHRRWRRRVCATQRRESRHARPHRSGCVA